MRSQSRKVGPKAQARAPQGKGRSERRARVVNRRHAAHATITLTIAAAATAIATASAGCAAPVLSRDGQLVFTPKGARGATVITANGVEFIDRSEIPQPVVRRSVNEPFRPATGFLLPASGVFRATSTPTPIQGRGLLVTLRSSDVLIPAWGGEVLLRLDAVAPTAAFPTAASSVRPPTELAIVLDGTTSETSPLVEAALEDLGGGDRVAIIDAGGARHAARPVLPLVAGAHRTLLRAAVDRIAAQNLHPSATGRDLGGALTLARGFLGAPRPGTTTTRHVLVLSDALGVARGGDRLAREVAALTATGIRITAVGTTTLAPDALAPLGADVHGDGLLAERGEAVDAAIRPPGDVVLEDVALSLSSVPAPARILESSGGESALGLDTDHLHLGDLYAGEARAEVIRLVLPPWVPGEPLELTVTATYRDAASGAAETAQTTLRCRYAADVEQIADSRRGDVIAYASALAMVRRLHRAFLGRSVDRLGGLRPVVELQARSLLSLGRTTRDPALTSQAEILSTLLGVIED
jgi:hypothetical protein